MSGGFAPRNTKIFFRCFCTAEDRNFGVCFVQFFKQSAENAIFGPLCARKPFAQGDPPPCGSRSPLPAHLKPMLGGMAHGQRCPKPRKGPPCPVFRPTAGHFPFLCSKGSSSAWPWCGCKASLPSRSTSSTPTTSCRCVPAACCCCDCVGQCRPVCLLSSIFVPFLHLRKILLPSSWAAGQELN